MRVSLNILLLLAISLLLLSTTSSALPISGDRTIESCPKGPQRQPSMKDRVKQAVSSCFGGGKIFLGYGVSDMMLAPPWFFFQQVKAKTLKATTINAGEGAVLTPFVDQWYDSNACAVYANKKKFENAHKLFVADINVITGSVSQILQKANQELHQTGDPFTKETTILFHRMAGSPIGPMQMLIPPHYLEPPDSNGRGDLGISIKCVSATEYKGTEKLLTQTVEWDKWNILYWPEEIKTTV
ncbi:uncharacterized protein C8R40DRAFT_1177060 [Lentinula edodes]|uniref:uncharacterized protein n=1 Tax=Lentinula edodes TaxID=5353 RepID=UPI001E8E5111|nr:uncharacterized protein C8R40DRAFT_1177060 [Lentinula edodes]KAH7869094.1 hypothetical protein C8R40DRAFT_1177060 [Lentinula edodes]